MIDFHTHILPALDDGAISIDDSIAMAKSLAAFGYKTVCCTPHCIKGYYDLTPQKVREATLMLQADLDNAEVQLDLWSGMEYMLDECFPQFAEDLLPLGETSLVLCEAPPQAHPGVVKDSLELIISKGFTPLVAHPERTPYFYEILCSRDEERGTSDADTLSSLPSEPKPEKGFLKKFFSSRIPRSAPRVEETSSRVPRPRLPEICIFQANLGSFTGFYGADVQRKAYDLLKLGAYTAMASDLHDSRSANQVLVYDKFAMNPILKQLADFDGTVPEIKNTQSKQEEEQCTLF